MSLWASFWDIIWWFVLAFAFISYLYALFAVIGDLFRDRKMNGWWKALWIIFLIFVPFLTVLVYLIMRGNGMAERYSSQLQSAKEATDSYIQQIAASSPSDEITKAKALLDAGSITADEYAQLKARALG